MTLSYTLHLRLSVPDFLSEPWHAEFAAAMESIDRAIYEGLIGLGATLWLNNTHYTIGTIVISPDNGSMYVAAIDHTSPPVPTTFTQELGVNPSRWAAFSVTALATQAEAEVGVENSHYMSALRTRQAITAQIGTSGSLIAFTSAPTAPVAKKGDFWYDTTTGVLNAYIDDGNTLQWVEIGPVGAGGGRGVTTPPTPQGRLTLTSGTPVMTATAAAQTIIYYSPYVGNQVPLLDGSIWSTVSFNELSAVTTDATKSPAVIGASKVNDWFVWLDPFGNVLRLSHGPDWTSDVLRAAAIQRQNGIWVNSGAITNGPAANKGTYVGTTRSNASSTLDWIYGAVGVGGTAGFFGVWNCYNRLRFVNIVMDSTNSWAYSTVTIRAANASATMRTSFVRGLDEDIVAGTYKLAVANTAGVNGIVGVGLDTTTAFSGLPGWQAAASLNITTAANWSGLAGLGFHYVSANEYVNSANVVTFYGDNGSSAFFQGGLIVELTA